MSLHQYARVLQDDLWNIDVTPLRKALEGAIAGGSFRVGAKADVLIVEALPDITDTTVLDATVAAQQVAFDALPELRARRIKQIDDLTRDLIAGGFEFPANSSNIFSQSENAQTNANSLRTLAADGVLPFPLLMPFLNDSGELEIRDVAMLTAYFQTGAARVLSIRLAGNVLKAAVRAATSKVELDMVVDGRT